MVGGGVIPCICHVLHACPSGFPAQRRRVASSTHCLGGGKVMLPPWSLPVHLPACLGTATPSIKVGSVVVVASTSVVQ